MQDEKSKLGHLIRTWGETFSVRTENDQTVQKVPTVGVDKIEETIKLVEVNVEEKEKNMKYRYC